MKTKLLSKTSLILATLGLLVSCGVNPEESSSDSSSTEPEAPQAETLALSAAIGWDIETMAPVYDGTLVRLEDCVVNATYDANRLSVAQYENETTTDQGTQIDIYAIEVLLAEENTTYAVKDVVTLEGIISSENGRPQLTDATITWGTEGQEKCDYNKDVEGSGGAVWYSQVNSGQERSFWDDVGRGDSGCWYEMDVAIASLPTVTAGQETMFYVTFPGENPDTEDVENLSLIEVNIPALTETQAANVNEWASQFEVGDFFKIFAQVWFDSYPQLMLPYSSFEFAGTNEPTTITGLVSSWQDLEDELFAKYTFLVPAFVSSDTYSYRYSHGQTTTGNVCTSITINVGDGLNAILEILKWDETTESYDTTDFEDLSWYLSGPFYDSSSDTLWGQFYNNEKAEVTTDDIVPSELSNGMIQFQVGETTINLLIVALDETALKEDASISWTTLSVLEYYSSLFQNPLTINELPASSGKVGHYVAFGYGDVNTPEGLLADAQLFLNDLLPEGFEIAMEASYDETDGSVSGAALWTDGTTTVVISVLVYWHANGFSVVQIMAYNM